MALTKKEISDRYWAKHRERLNNKSRSGYYANKEKRLAYTRNWQEKNKERIKEVRQKYIEKRRDYINAKKRENYQKNIEQRCKRDREFYWNNRIKTNVRRRERHILKQMEKIHAERSKVVDAFYLNMWQDYAAERKKIANANQAWLQRKAPAENTSFLRRSRLGHDSGMTGYQRCTMDELGSILEG